MTENWRQHPHYSIDPFPNIPPALLNSSDIAKYGEAGCLVTSFDDDRLKTSSYTMMFAGTLYQWERKSERGALGISLPLPSWLNNDRRRTECAIKPDKRYKLPRNSISYLFMEEEFRLPEYIAARINFRIPFVHRGMLLGTGPLVDAGFSGSLLIPLHNLTDNDYYIKGGEGIIWVEFTKLSPHPYWCSAYKGDRSKRPDDLKFFPDEKYGIDAEQYLEKADINRLGGVESAFKGALDEARQAASESKRLISRLTWSGVIAVIAVFVGLCALVQSNNQMATQVVEQIGQRKEPVRSSVTGAPMASDEVEGLRQKFEEIEDRVQRLEDLQTASAGHVDVQSDALSRE